MKKSEGFWQVAGFSFTVMVGTVLHFLYEWLGDAKWISPFSGVNESTWEHMKLLFWPMFVFAVFQWFFFRDRKDFWCVKRRGILLGLMLIPVIFYLFNGMVAKSPDWLNILIFFIAAAGAYAYEKWLFDTNTLHCPSPKSGLAPLMLIALCFVVFTFKTPRLNIFKDPLTGTYGI